MSIEIESFELPPIGTQCYVVSNPENQEFAVFDAPLNAWPTVERYAVDSGYRLTGLYFTHGHWDHTLDGWLFNQANVPCHAHKGDNFLFEKPGIMAAFFDPGVEMHPCRIDTWLEDGSRIGIAGRPVEVRYVPGHSPGSILYWFVEDGFAISGDAIFNGNIGRYDFPGCSLDVLRYSIRTNIYTLPDETILYPGHGPETTVGREAASNPAVRR